MQGAIGFALEEGSKLRFKFAASTNLRFDKDQLLFGASDHSDGEFAIPIRVPLALLPIG